MTNWKAIAGRIAAFVLILAMIAAVLLPTRNAGQEAPATASVYKGEPMQRTTQDVSITALAATIDKTPAVVDFIAVDAEISENVVAEETLYLAADETSAAVRMIPAVQLHKEEAEAKAQAESDAAAEQLAAEEAAKKAAEQKAAEEAAKKAAEQKAAEEAAKKAAEQKAAEEAAKKAAEQKAAEEAAKKAEESKAAETVTAVESKVEESKAEESKAEESKAAESKVEESKAEESVAQESKAEESVAAEPVVEEPVVEESVVEETPQYETDDSPLDAFMGVNYYNGHKETYYNMYMGGLIEAMNRGGWAYNDCINKDIINNILDTSGYWVRSDGCKMFGDYIILAANAADYSRGSIVATSLGMGIVLDRGCAVGVIDIAVNW